MALFRDSFEHFKVQAWLNDPAIHPDGALLTLDLPQSPKRKRSPGRGQPTSANSPSQNPVRPPNRSFPSKARKPLQATTRSNMAARASEDADPLKNPTKPPKTRGTPTTLPNRQNPRRQSPRKIAAPVSSVRNAMEEIRPMIRGRAAQDDRGAELQDQPTPTVDLQSASFVGTLLSGKETSPPTSWAQSQSSKQTRSTSPSKSMHDLAMADPPIRFYEAKSICPPDGVAKLYQKISHACRGLKLLPHSLKDEIMLYSQSEYLSLEDFHFEDKPKLQSELDLGSQGQVDVTQEDRQIWKEVKHIAGMALKCSQDNASEAAWGERVYGRIFYSALEAFRLQGLVGWENITTARIEPQTLTPRHLTGKTFASKMVDYAFVLLPDETMHRAILDLLRQSLDDEDHNINQTRSGPVRFRPITVNIEVKVPGEGRNQTMVQLSVWVTAQFKKLNALTGDRGAVQDICIPLISVEGHDWRVCIAYQTADGEVVIWGNQVFGDTASVLGVYRVIAGLRTLAEWSYSEYRAWFEREVLQIDV